MCLFIIFSFQLIIILNGHREDVLSCAARSTDRAVSCCCFLHPCPKETRFLEQSCAVSVHCTTLLSKRALRERGIQAS